MKFPVTSPLGKEGKGEEAQVFEREEEGRGRRVWRLDLVTEEEDFGVLK